MLLLSVCMLQPGYISSPDNRLRAAVQVTHYLWSHKCLENENQLWAWYRVLSLSGSNNDNDLYLIVSGNRKNAAREYGRFTSLYSSLPPLISPVVKMGNLNLFVEGSQAGWEKWELWDRPYIYRSSMKFWNPRSMKAGIYLFKKSSGFWKVWSSSLWKKL